MLVPNFPPPPKKKPQTLFPIGTSSRSGQRRASSHYSHHSSFFFLLLPAFYFSTRRGGARYKLNSQIEDDQMCFAPHHLTLRGPWALLSLFSNFPSFDATEKLFRSNWGRISLESDWCYLKTYVATNFCCCNNFF